MSIPNSVLIAITEINGTIDHTKPLNEKMLDAMKLALNHWLIIEEEEQFNAAVGAVLTKATEEEQEKIKNQLQLLKTLSAVLSGVPVDMEEAIKSIPKIDEEDKFVLNTIWKQAKDENKK